jgi:hypothetical protein
MRFNIEEAELVHHDVISAGRSFYDRQLRHILEPEHEGRFVAVEPVSGMYFLGNTDSEALWAAHKAMPTSQFFVKRIGHVVTHRMGGYGFNQRQRY